MADHEPQAAPIPSPEPGESMRAVGRFIAAVGVAVIIGAVIGGVHLITVKACGINPYGGSPDCQFATTHPDAGAGWAVLVGGSANGAVVLTVAWLCNVVAKHRDALTRILTDS